MYIYTPPEYIYTPVFWLSLDNRSCVITSLHAVRQLRTQKPCI